MKMYSKIKSKFVQSELKKASWKKREYINHLMDIEKLATGSYVSTGAGYIAHSLKGEYPRQWKIIHLELDPQGYKEGIKEERKEREQERRENKRFEREERQELAQARRDWKKMGGK